MNNVILDLLGLPGIGRGSIRKILKMKDLSLYSSDNLDQLIDDANMLNYHIKVPTKQEISTALERTRKTIDICENNNIHILTEDSINYPARFRSISDYPVILFIKGNMEILNYEKNIAIIGTRKPSEQGVLLAEKLSKWFAKNGYVITSGLAIGCDTAAHMGCLAVDGKTVAILANSLETISPKINTDLAERIILKNGCLLSEYAPGETTLRSNFIERDRLQSALAQGVIVVETAIGGGSNHAVKAGIAQGRHIACVDFGINAVVHQDGNIALIHEGKAMAISCNEDLKRFADLLNVPCCVSTFENSKASKQSSYTQISIFDM